MKAMVLGLGLCVAAGWVSPGLLQAAPPNDDFSAATIVAGFPATATGSNVDATVEAGEPLPNTGLTASVWFQWTAATSGAVQIDTMGSEHAVALAVWTNSEFAHLELVVQNDPYDHSGRGAGFFDVVSGTTYQIAVYGYGDDLGAIALRITNDVLSRIAGTVTGPEGTPLLEGHLVVGVREDAGGGWQMMGSGLTDAEGNYEIRGLPADSYRIWFGGGTNGDYVAEIHENASTYDSGTAIVVAGGETVTGIDAELAAASKISGTVTGPDGEPPLEGIEVTVHGWDESWGYWSAVAEGRSEAAGAYTVGGLAAGTYRVGFSDWQNGDYLTEVYSNAVDLESGLDVVVAATTLVTGIDASLAVAGKIAGTVTGPDGEVPLEGIQATAHVWNETWEGWEPLRSGTTDANGNYAIGGLAAGTYRVEFQDWQNGDYLTEAYADAQDVDSGTDVVVGAGEVVGGVDAALGVAAKISGTVTGPDGETPLENFQVSVFVWDGSDWQQSVSGYTGSDGAYTIGGLAAGTYRVRFYGGDGTYVTETYDDGADLESGTDVVAVEGETVTGIDAALALAAHISGTVTGPDGETPLEGIQATAYHWNEPLEYWELIGSASTDLEGVYTIGNLAAGTYRVDFRDGNDVYASEAYNNAVAVASGMDIVVGEGETAAGIDAALEPAAGISGTVTDAEGMPLVEIDVSAYRWNGEVWMYANGVYTGVDGGYEVEGLMAGTYRVYFNDASAGEYIAEFYRDAADLASGQDIVVAAGETATGIDAALAVYSKISGTVTRLDGTPLMDINASVFRWDGEGWVHETGATTGMDGEYEVAGLVAGTYRVVFYDFNTGEYISEAYDNAADLEAGADIVLAEGEMAAGIDAALALAVYSTISGTVTRLDGTTPVAGIAAGVWRWGEYGWEFIQEAVTDADGNYAVGGLPAGTYRVWYSDGNGDYISEAYDNAADLNSGTDVVMAEGETVTGIDAALALAAHISGTVTGPDGSPPLEGIQVTVYRWNEPLEYWETIVLVSTDLEGVYTIGGLAAGTYRVAFMDGSDMYASEAYSNAAAVATGMDIVVGAGETAAGIDAALGQWSKISGTVTRLDGTTPLGDIYVAAYRWNGEDWEYGASTYTDLDGGYELGGLPADTYRVCFIDYTGTYSSEIHDDVLWRWDWEDGADIVLAEGASATGIDAALSLPSSAITGTVTAGDGTTPLQNLHVLAYRRAGAQWDFVTENYTDAAGSYVLNGFGAGTYRVVFQDFSENYFSEVYDNVPGLDCGAAGADLEVAEDETVAGIDARLSAVGTPPAVAGVRWTGADGFEVQFLGTEDLRYILQEATSLTGAWTDVGTPVSALSGTTALPRDAGATRMYWRVRQVP